MKNFLIVVALLLSSLQVFSQMQDLNSMANGDIVYSDIIYDNQSHLWGYFYLYKLDKGKVLDKMEYVVLDKNLNKIYNGTYESPKSMTYYKFRKYNDCSLMGDYLVLDISLTGANYELFYNSMRILPLKDNQVSEEFFFDGKAIKPVPEKSEKISTFKLLTDSLYNSMIVYPVYEGAVKGYFMYPTNLYYRRVREKRVDFYDESRNLKWSYLYNKNTTNKTRDPYTTFNYLFHKGKYIYALERDMTKTKTKSNKFIGLNIETGKKEFEYEIENDSSKFDHEIIVDIFNDTVLLSGNYYHKSVTSYKTLGYYRIAIDPKGKEIYRKYNKWADLSTPEMTLKTKPVTKKRIALDRKSVIVYRDGSTSILHQGVKYLTEFQSGIRFFTLGLIKAGNTYAGDFYVYQFDKDFNFKRVQTIKKNRTIYTNNFIFTRDNDDKTESLALIYNNKKLDALYNIVERDLLISRITKDTVRTESIPLFQKQKYSIEPLPAKDGYIILWERNEKDKYNQIRLEKIND
jgi:hypothetical protein